MVPVLYVKVGDIVWKVFDDGHWEPLAAGEAQLPNIQTVIQESPELLDPSTQTPEDIVLVEQQLQQTIQSLTRTINQSQGIVDTGSSGTSSESAGFIAPLYASLDETIAEAGYDTRPNDTRDSQDESRAPIETLDILADSARLTVVIEDGGDGYENQFEVPAVVIRGTAVDVRDGRTVEITISDQSGNQVQIQTSVNDETYLIEGVDLADLEEGPLTVSAIVTDQFDNSISAVDDTIKDTLASIDVVADGFGDQFVNANEVSEERWYGRVDNVEAGQPITLVVTDINGDSLTFTTVTSDGGLWEINTQDITELADGDVIVTASTIDIAGNPATSTDVIVKDTTASITITIDDGGDGVLNETELQATRVFGQVVDIEDGQSVVVTLSGSPNVTVTYQTTVENGQWEVTDIDLSAMDDGPISATAVSQDIAGNIAAATDDVTTINTVKPSIDIDTLAGFDILDFRSGGLTTMQGTTQGVEESLPVTITVSDGTTTVSFQGAVDGVGNWQVGNIDVSTLDLNSEWTVLASVQNGVGNLASDDMPTIALSESVAFSETIIGIFGEQSTESDVNVNFAEFTFYNQQEFLDTITSQGLEITLQISDYLIRGIREDGDKVFEAILMPDGDANSANDKVEITFFEAVDELDGAQSIQSAIVIQGVQTDSDATSETVLGYLPISVTDADPIIFDEQYSVVEGKTVVGNVLNNDIDLDGKLTLSNVTVDGVSKPVSSATPAVFILPEGALTVFANGQWSFFAERNLDNSMLQQVEFTYVASDVENDTGQGTATITIVDGEAGKIINGNTTEVEIDSAARPQMFESTFSVIAGSDNPDPDSLVFDKSTLSFLDDLSLTSGISLVALTYTLSADGKTITGFSGNDQVLSFTLSGVVDPIDSQNVVGTIAVTLERSLNHDIVNDSITFPLIIQGTDIDGSLLTRGEFDLTLLDGSDPILTQGTPVTIEESALIDGAKAGTGDFEITLGSDSLGVNQSFNPLVFFDAADQPDLTSNGQSIEYRVGATGADLSGYIKVAGGEDILVFTLITEQPDPYTAGDTNYTFTLYQALDQRYEPFEIPFVITVSDADDDIEKLTLPITVNDSGAATIGTAELEVVELPKTIGSYVGIDSDAVANITIASSLDAIVDISLGYASGSEVKDSSNTLITSNGEDLFWRDNGNNTYDAVTTSGNVAFRVSLSDGVILTPNSSQDIELKIEIFTAIDHTLSDEILVNLPIKTLDSDGTETLVVSTAKIYDGRDPKITIDGSLAVDEDGLLGDSFQEATADTSPTITQIQGSDEFIKYAIDIAQFDAFEYTSGGPDNKLTLAAEDENGWYRATNTDGDDVFTIRLNDDGTVEFVLYRPLDHEDTGLNDENNLALTFQVFGVDADGDVSSQVPLTVDVKDAIPESTTESLELTEGDSYTGSLLTQNVVGADGGTIISFKYYDPTTPSVGDKSYVYTFNKETGQLLDESGVAVQDNKINLLNPNDLDINGRPQAYGTFVLNQDGSLTIETSPDVDAAPRLDDSIQFTVEDNDGDEVENTANLILDDSIGFIRTIDTETKEDTLTEQLAFFVATGDLDSSEQVENIQISETSLDGGKLIYDGVELIPVNGVYTFSVSQLIAQGEFVGLRGVLKYLPPTHQSNTTISISLAISALVSKDSGATTYTLSDTLDVSVLPVADEPDWGASQFEYSVVEDVGMPLSLAIDANLVDLDSSESIRYAISNIPDGVTITLNGQPIVQGKSYKESELNDMKVVVEEHLSGSFNFDIAAIATEKGNTFDDPADKTAEVTQVVTINVSPDADAPSLAVKDIRGLEDNVIDLKDAIFGSLVDVDGSETLSYRIEVQEGWTFSGSGFTLESPNVYLVTATAIDNSDVKLVPKQDISSYTESLSIKVTAIATESTVDGVPPNTQEATSDTKTITIQLKGVVDEPTVVDGGNGHWSFDSTNKEINSTGSFNEDQLVQLDFSIITTDNDLSESVNILITGIPDSVQLVDSSGNPVALSIAGIDDVTGTVYQLSNSELANLYAKPLQDFSGQFSFIAKAISTEPDGDSGEFVYSVNVDLLPVVDQNDGASSFTTGIEDVQIALNLNQSVNQDIDGSETLTGYIIDPLPSELTLYFDGALITVPSGGLNLETLIDSTSPTLDSLLNSGRLTVVPFQDLSGTFSIPVRYEVTDTTTPASATTVTKEISGSLTVQVDAKVEIDTRLESSVNVFTSDDGSPVDVSNSIRFVDEDIDGSEYLDYIILDVPTGYDLIVKSNGNEAQQTPDGNWVISANGITSDTIQETATLILDGVTIESKQDTPVLDIIVKARVIDGEDAKYIDGSFQIQVTGHSGGGGGSCDPVGPPGDIEGSSDIKFDEGTEVIDLTGLLDANVASDPNNEISFFVPSISLPPDVELEGNGVIPIYDSSGSLVGYSISQSGLESLKIVGLDEDFAGCFSFTVETTETSNCNGDTKTTIQTVNIEIRPVVDEISLSTSVSSIDEDIATNLNLELILGDSIVSGQTVTGEGESATGKETVNSLTLTVSNGAVIQAEGDPTWLIDNGNGTWTITDSSKLSEIELVPPQHFSGDITITAVANITDEADCTTDTDTQDKTVVKTIHINPVVDQADLASTDVIGDEDNYISLDVLRARLVDQDGSESMSLSLAEVPEGAVVAIKVGEEYQLLPNNGKDGGSFNGQPTYEWQLDASQLSNTYILPPLDFSGDIPLILKAITQETETGDVRVTDANFVLGVKPIGDDLTFFDVPEHIDGDEDLVINVPVNISSLETNSDEFIALSFVIETSSDPTALTGLEKIKIGSQSAKFVIVNGAAVATLVVAASEVDEIEFYAGNAFGNMDVTIKAESIDQNTVLGSLDVDLGPVFSQSLQISVTPEVDEPILNLTYDSIYTEAQGSIPLGLDMSLLNPAPDETGTLTIKGLPTDYVLSAGTRVGDDYIVDWLEAQTLAIESGYSGDDNFILLLEPSAELNGDVADGLSQQLLVNLYEVDAENVVDTGTFGKDLFIGTDNADNFSGGLAEDRLEGKGGNDVLDGGTGDDVIISGAGSDTLTGGAGSDTFVFTDDDIGALLVRTDTITDFDYSANTDVIDISAILTSSDRVAELEEVDSGTSVRINIIDNSAPDAPEIEHHILLENITLAQLQGSGSDALQQMIDDQNLIVS